MKINKKILFIVCSLILLSGILFYTQNYYSNNHKLFVEGKSINIIEFLPLISNEFDKGYIAIDLNYEFKTCLNPISPNPINLSSKRNVYYFILDNILEKEFTYIYYYSRYWKNHKLIGDFYFVEVDKCSGEIVSEGKRETLVEKFNIVYDEKLVNSSVSIYVGGNDSSKIKII